METFEKVSVETIQSTVKINSIEIIFGSFLNLFVGAKEFANEAWKMSSEFANHAGEYLQEKVPVALEG